MSLLFSQRKSPGATRMNAGHSVVMFFIRHLQQALASLGELWRVPASSLLTMAVLGVSLSLPATLHVLLKNTDQLRNTWDNAAEVSLFLKDHISEQQALKAVNRIKLYSQVSDVTYVSQEQALNEFKQLSGFGEALSYLDSNPLPAVILVTPTSQFSSPEGARELLEVLEQQNEVAFGKLDVTWLEKLTAIVNLLKDAVFALGFLLLLAVTLVIANTIRLSILNRREEIEILKLVGATDSFIRRPFLYTGFWYGLIGGVIAWVCVSLMLWSLEGALSALANELDADLMLDGLAFSEFLILIALSAWLGWLGAYFSVTRHVNEIEPENQI